MRNITDKVIKISFRANYSAINLLSLKKILIPSHNFLYIAKSTTRKKYLIKIFSFKKRRIVYREQKNILLAEKNGIKTPPMVKNVSGKVITVDKKNNFIILVFKYIEGKNYRSSLHLSESQIKLAAEKLAVLHNFNISGQAVARVNLRKDLLVGYNIYKKISCLRDSFKCGINNPLVLKIIEQRANKSFLKLFKSLIFSRKSLCLIHGDYAPSNLIYVKKHDISLIDWEHSCVYYWQYDLFRAICNFSSAGRFTAYDSIKKINKIFIFLKYYFKARKNIATSELELFKAMPKIYCFIDVFPYSQIYLANRLSLVKKYLPLSEKAYKWWIKNEDAFIAYINKECKLKE